MSEVTYAGRTIDSDRFADAKFVLHRLVTKHKANILADTIYVDGFAVKVDDIDTVLALASYSFYRLSQEQKCSSTPHAD